MGETLAEIDAIGARPHSVLRNLRITQAHYELSTATVRRIGSAANWCTFATWASKQAGQSVRGDDLGRKMTLTLDQTTLHLGSDLTGSFPALLATIADRELGEFVSRVDPTRDTVRRSGSHDWAALPGRMHFIADLFRLYLETPGLLRAPFTPEQLATIADGHTPDGQL